MYEHVAVEHLLFQVLQHRKHYTAHHKRLTAPNRKHVPIRERQRKQADRVEERVYCRAFIQHAEVSKRTKIWQSAYSEKPYNYTHRWCDAQSFCFSFDPSTMQYCSSSSYLTSTYRTCVRRPGCPGGERSRHLQVVTSHKTVDLSVHFIRVWFNYLLVSERGGR